MNKEKLKHLKNKVINRVRKEYKLFVIESLKNGEWYLFNNSLKITFFKELYTYIQNGMLCDYLFIHLYKVENILATLWNRYVKNELERAEKDYIYQLLDLHFNNIVRMHDRNK